MDITELLNKVKHYKTQWLNVTSVAISAAITAYAKTHISQLKLTILNQLGGKIYYSDTDSIVTNVKLPEHMIDSNELGKLKLEHLVNRGVFISGKLYAIIDDKDQIIIRSKKVNSNSRIFDDFIFLLNNEHIHHAIKTQSKIDWGVGHVSIKDKQISLFGNYKRKKSTKMVHE